MNKKILVQLMSALKSYHTAKQLLTTYLDMFLLEQTEDSEDVSRVSYDELITPEEQLKIKAIVAFDFSELFSKMQHYIKCYTSIVTVNSKLMQPSSYAICLFKIYLYQFPQNSYIEAARAFPDILALDLKHKGISQSVAAFYIQRPYYREKYQKCLKEIGKAMRQEKRRIDIAKMKALKDSYLSQFLTKQFSKFIKYSPSLFSSFLLIYYKVGQMYVRKPICYHQNVIRVYLILIR